MHVQMEGLCARAAVGEATRTLCARIAGATAGSRDDYGTAGQRPDRAAYSPGFSAPEAARGEGGNPGGGRTPDPGVGIQDQPDGTGAGQLQGTRRRGPA